MAKMGFDERRTPMQSYGHSGDIMVAGKVYHYASEAEKKWLEHMEPVIAEKKCDFRWQPKPFLISYHHAGHECHDTYRPDARIIWNDSGEEWFIEIKRGALHQKSASKMKRFCQQYPLRKLVLVWFGSWPKKGVARRRLDKLEPWLDHVWRMK